MTASTIPKMTPSRIDLLWNFDASSSPAVVRLSNLYA